MTIISQIKIDGEWVDQDKVPETVVKGIIYSAICRGMREIRFFPNEKTKEKTA